MPDVHATTTVNRWKLTNLRDTLREQADNARDWLAYIGERRVLSQQDVADLNSFCVELEGDLNDWCRFLTEQIGDDAE